MNQNTIHMMFKNGTDYTFIFETAINNKEVLDTIRRSKIRTQYYLIQVNRATYNSNKGR